MLKEKSYDNVLKPFAYSPYKDLWMEINLTRMIKVKDLKEDGKVFIKHIRIGKG